MVLINIQCPHINGPYTYTYTYSALVGKAYIYCHHNNTPIYCHHNNTPSPSMSHTSPWKASASAVMAEGDWLGSNAAILA